MNLLIRQAKPQDDQAIADIYGPYIRDTVITFEESPISTAQIRQRIVETLEQFPYLVGEVGGKVVGYVYAGAHAARASYRWSVNVAVYLDPEYHRRGIGRLMYQQLFPLLESQGYAMAYAGITLPNPASVGLHESLGFSPVGIYRRVGFKFDAWRDVGWWERAMKNYSNSVPPEPIAWKHMAAFTPVTKSEIGHG